MATAHIAAENVDFAPDVLMPGDPRRAKRIAETVLEDARLVTEVRGMLGYTGTYQGRPVSVMGSGMGIPSIAIYATELYRFFGVERIIRIGTAGGMAPFLNVGDVVIGTAAHTDSDVLRRLVPGAHYSATPDFGLASAAYAAAQQQGEGAVYAGAIFSSDSFYNNEPELRAGLVAHGTLGVEMEAAGLYGVADREGKKALAICSISDLMFRAEELSAAEREQLFDRAVQLGLAAFANA